MAHWPIDEERLLRRGGYTAHSRRQCSGDRTASSDQPRSLHHQGASGIGTKLVPAGERGVGDLRILSGLGRAVGRDEKHDLAQWRSPSTLP